MKEHYISYEQAVKLKELGFDWEVNHIYNALCEPKFFESTGLEDTNYHNVNNSNFVTIFSAPTLAQAQAWLRDCKGIAVCVFPERYNEDIVQGIYRERLCGWDFEIWNLKEEEEYDIPNIGYRESYESALSTGISKALELLEKK